MTPIGPHLTAFLREYVRIPVNWSTDSGGSGPASESLTQV